MTFGVARGFRHVMERGVHRLFNEPNFLPGELILELEGWNSIAEVSAQLGWTSALQGVSNLASHCRQLARHAGLGMTTGNPDAKPPEPWAA